MERGFKRLKINFSVNTIHKQLNGDIIIKTTCGQTKKYKHGESKIQYNSINKKINIKNI